MSKCKVDIKWEKVEWANQKQGYGNPHAQEPLKFPYFSFSFLILRFLSPANAGLTGIQLGSVE